MVTTIYAYLRISTDKQDIKKQRNVITKYCEELDLHIDSNDVFIDDNLNDKLEWTRRSINTIISRMKHGDILIVTNLSRLGRTIHEIAEIMKICMNTSVTVIDIENNITYDNTQNTKKNLEILNFYLQLDKSLTSERLKQGHMTSTKVKKVRKEWIKKNKLDGKKDEILELVKAGKSLNQIGIKYGVFAGQVKDFLAKHDLTQYYCFKGRGAHSTFKK